MWSNNFDIYNRLYINYYLALVIFYFIQYKHKHMDITKEKKGRTFFLIFTLLIYFDVEHINFYMKYFVKYLDILLIILV